MGRLSDRLAFDTHDDLITPLLYRVNWDCHFVSQNPQPNPASCQGLLLQTEVSPHGCNDYWWRCDCHQAGIFDLGRNWMHLLVFLATSHQTNKRIQRLCPCFGETRSLLQKIGKYYRRKGTQFMTPKMHICACFEEKSSCVFTRRQV